MVSLKPSRFSRYERNYTLYLVASVMAAIAALVLYKQGFRSDTMIIVFFSFMSVSSLLLIPTAIQISDLIFEKKAILALSFENMYPVFDIVEMLEEINGSNNKITIQERVSSLRERLNSKVSI